MTSPSPSASNADLSAGGHAPPSAMPTIDLMGMAIASCTERQLLDHCFRELSAGRGGWIVTANLDFLRRHHQQPDARALYAQADLRVADGMPLVWASHVQGNPLPERIAGSSLLRPLARRAAQAGRSLYLLGGDTGTAEQAAEELCVDCPKLHIAGHESPWLELDPSEAAVAPIRSRLLSATPDFVLVALGSPKQEQLIARLRECMPQTWFVGVGASFSLLTGKTARAPRWMQQAGLEWAHRLSQEPSRLARRYLVEDAPFGLQLLGRALAERLTGR